ncbi:cadherin domain-containing protein [Sphingobium estronivorans]|uniref:cadherin domain-containing protein n=1 Tax=Sphingobium estronivorans TaxID=1577690 RepID=UPI00123B22FA|nr:cadherin domain-containing protein [Sphingobium estronivorans]
MTFGHSVTIDGSLNDWFATDRIDDNGTSGYEIYSTFDSGDFVFALKAPVAIGANTTVWLNTDGKTSTGYQIFGFAGGAEYNVNFAADGTINLYTGAAGQTLVLSGLTAAWSADHTVVEFRLPAASVGNPAAMYSYYDINDAIFMPSNYQSAPFTVFNQTTATEAPDMRIGIVFSQTTADAYFSSTAYSQLFMSVQSQAMQAGIPFDILTEDDLTDLNKLSHYDALVFPSFRNVPTDKVEAITHTLEIASKQLGIGLIAAGEFMTNQPYVQGGAVGGDPLPGDPYAQMKVLFDATRVTGGTGDVQITATDASGLVLDHYANGQQVNSYTNVGWNAFASVSGTGHQIATETINGGQSYSAALATQTGSARNVLFSSEGIMADANMLQQAISYSANGTGMSVGLHLTRDAGIVAARVDMDQSQELEDVNPPGSTPGIYDKLIPILQQWKADYNFVGSFYLNVGNGTDGTGTDWNISLPYYKAILDLGSELGTHSLTHPEDTNVLTAAQIQTEFQNSTTILNTQLSNYLGQPYQIVGAAVPGAPETLATSQEILQYVTDYLTGGYAAQGAGYPNAFGYLTPANQSQIYFAPNTSFDFTLIEFQHKSVADATAAWLAEFDKIVANAQTPVVVWPWHDYGAADFLSGSPTTDSPYDISMFTAWLQHAVAANMEFVTLDDLAQRMTALKNSTVTSSVSGNTISASVSGANVGNLSLDVDRQGSLVIQNVTGWYAYDSNSVFLPQSGGTFTIHMGAAADDVTHITDLPMRAVLLSVTGDGHNLAFSLQGEGKVIIDIANPGTDGVVVSGANVVDKSGEIWTLDLGSYGLHTVTLTYQNAPVITSNGGLDSATLSVPENSTAVTTVIATDPDVGTTISYSISGGADAAKFVIDGATGILSFVSAPNFEAPGDVGANNVYDVIVRASDGTLFDEQAIAVTVTDVNEPPTITSNGGGATAAISMGENLTAVTTVTATDPDANTILAYSIAGGVDAAKFAIDSKTGALSFIAAPNFEQPDDAGGDHVYNVIVRASDGTLVADQALAVTITNVNEPPTITSNGGGASASITMAENLTAVTTVTATDPDANTTLTYSLAGGADSGKFTINSTTGALSFITAPNFDLPGDAGKDNIYNVNVRVSDGSLTATQALAITITNADEPPTITSNGGGATASVSVRSNSTAVTTVTATDPDVGTVLTYSISGGVDAAKFVINSATGALSFATAPDFTAPTDNGANNVYDVIVRASDGALYDEQAIAVTITNNNRAPIITSNGGGATASLSKAENVTAVTIVQAFDSDGNPLTYSISGGVDADKFAINSSTGALTFITPPDYENPTDSGGDHVYNVIVRASDGQLFDDQALAVTITNVNEAPTITSNGGGATASLSMAEGTTAVTTVTAADPDAGTTFRYSISGGADAARFIIDSATGALSFRKAPNFEAPTDSGANNVYDVIVRVSDGKLFASQALAVTVVDANDAPVITSNGGGATAKISMKENILNVTKVVAADPDIGDHVSYSIANSGDGALFVIDGTSGQLSFITAPDYENPGDVDHNNVYQLRVVATDSHGATDFQDITVTIGNVGGISLTAGSSGSSLMGTPEDDKLTGGAGADTLNGMGGNDRITGGNGADILIGGGGADTFIYTNVQQSTPLVMDQIMDFQSGIDKIDLSGIDANTTTGGNQAFTFIGDLGFSAPGQLHVVSAGSDTLIEANTDNNPATVEFAIRLVGSHAVQSDFML